MSDDINAINKKHYYNHFVWPYIKHVSNEDKHLESMGLFVNIIAGVHKIVALAYDGYDVVNDYMKHNFM
jgi:hypothetical protein